MAEGAVTPGLEQRLAARDTGDRCPVMFQTWRQLLFLHWRVDAVALQTRMPPGLNIDLFDGEAFVGIVPFFMCDVRPTLLPCLPGLSNFLELNVRTYVHDDDGVPGVWFFSLDANLAPAVWAARTFFKLPYRHARMSGEVSAGGWVDYASACAAGDYSGTFRYRGSGDSGEADPGSLEFFLLERYYLYAFDARRGRLLRGQVAHAPYRFRQAEVDRFDPGPMLGQDIFPPDLDGDANFDHACFADEVGVRILGLERVD